MAALPPPPPPPPPPPAPSLPPLPALPSSPRPADHAGRLVFLLGLVATLGLVAGLVAVWPDDDGPAAVDVSATSTTLMTAELAEQLGAPAVDAGGGGAVAPRPDVQLFQVGPSAAVQEVLQASGSPTQLIQVTIYPTYLFVAYRDPAAPDAIDRRMWRGGQVDPPDANPIDDRVDADTTPQLFDLAELGPALDRITQLVADAPTRYPMPVEVTHIIIDRFLPFDPRVLIRVYASPADDRSGGGYVSYTTNGDFVKLCC